MGTVLSNLKARFGVDTGDFRRGLKDGEKALSDFKDLGTDQISEFAGMFNVNMGAVNAAINGAGKALNFIGQSFKAAKTGGDAFMLTMNGVKTALAATGIGALILALGSLIAYFKETETGAKQLASGMSQVKAVWESLKDRLAAFGGGLISIVRGDFVNGILSIRDAFEDLGKREKEAAARGKEVAQAIYDVTRQEREFNVRKSEQLVLIDELKLKSRDLELSAQERLDALTKASETEKKFNKEAIDIATQRIYIAQQNLLIDQDNEDLKNELAQAYIEYNRVVSESIQFDYSLTRQKNALIKEIKEQKKAEEELLKTQKEANAVNKISGIGIPGFDTTTLAKMPNWKEGKSQMQEFGETAVEMGNMVNESLSGMVAGMSEWFGAFATGMATAEDAKMLVGTAFGDMLINLGRVAISAGIGIEAIKKAFASLSGIGAIAIGVSLVAFGSLIKGAVQNIGTGGGGTIASGTPGNYIYDTRSIAPGTGGTQTVKHVVEMQLTGKVAKGLIVIEDRRRKGAT